VYAFRCPYEYGRACIQAHRQHLTREVKAMRALPYFSPIAKSFSRASASAWPCALAWAMLGEIVLVGHALMSSRHGWFEIGVIAGFWVDYTFLIFALSLSSFLFTH